MCFLDDNGLSPRPSLVAAIPHVSMYVICQYTLIYRYLLTKQQQMRRYTRHLTVGVQLPSCLLTILCVLLTLITHNACIYIYAYHCPNNMLYIYIYLTAPCIMYIHIYIYIHAYFKCPPSLLS